MGSRFRSISTRFFDNLEKPQVAFLLALVIYFLLSILGGNPFRARGAAYFNYLADAFLHGQLHLRLLPDYLHDLSVFNGRYYLYGPPMPAILLMPLVALFGVNFSDVLFNLLVASANVAVVAALLRAVDRAGVITINAERRGMLVLFFAFGTVHMVLAPFGRVWFTAQLVGFFLVGLAYLSAIELRGSASFIVTGVLMGCAMLTRNHLLLTGIWPAYYLISRYWNDRPRLYLHMAAGLLPVLVMGLLFLNYNYARFGDPFELGIRYHQMADVFVEDYQKYGTFNLYYVPINFFYQYIAYPFPLREETLMGGSLFLLSPVFFYVFKGVANGHRTPSIWFLVLSILATSIPILLLMGTGWVQYGPRYTLDFTIPLLMLTAVGVQGASRGFLILLTALSILQYIPGVIMFSML